jgi:hypothetical protein
MNERVTGYIRAEGNYKFVSQITEQVVVFLRYLLVDLIADSYIIILKDNYETAIYELSYEFKISYSILKILMMVYYT